MRALSRDRGFRLVQRFACCVDERRERTAVAHGQIGEDLSIDCGARRFQAGHELRVGDAVRPCRGVDPADPELAEIALAILAAGEGGVESALDLLLGDAVAPRLHPPVAFGQLEDLGAAVLSLGTSFDSRHDSPRFYSFERSGQEMMRARSRSAAHRYGSIRFTVFRLAFDTSVSEPRAAFRPGRFLVRMCEWKAWLRRILPFELFLNRLAAPR